MSLAARAGDYGTCPGVDVVEADLRNSNSPGYYLPELKLILINRLSLQRSSVPVGKFFLAHECAHTDPAVGSDENAADCAAAKRGTEEGWLGQTELVQVCVKLARMIPDGNHLSPAFRCGNVRRCAALAAHKPGQTQDKVQQANGKPDHPGEPDSDATPLSTSQFSVSKSR